MLNKNFFFFFIFLSWVYAQNFQESTVYVERDSEIEERVDKAISQQLKNNIVSAAEEYSSILKMVSGVVTKYRTSNLSELKRLEETIKKYKEQNFSFQKKGKTNSLLFVKEVLNSLGFVISRKELDILSKKYEANDKIATLWPLYNNNNTGGWNIGMREYLHRLLKRTPKDVKKKLVGSPDQQKEVVKKAWMEHQPQILEKFFSENPLQLHRPKSWSQLGDLYFSCGRMGDAYNAWRTSLIFHPKYQRRTLVAKSAIASFLNGDINIYKRFVGRYRKSKDRITIGGQKIALGKFIKTIPQKFEMALQNNWPSFKGNNSHNANVIDLQNSSVTTKEIAVGSSFRSNRVFVPIFGDGCLFLRQANELICIEFDDILRKPNNGRLAKKWSYRNRAVAVSGYVKNMPTYDTVTYANGSVYLFTRNQQTQTYAKIIALDAKNGKTLWEWPQKNTKKMHLNFSPLVVDNKLYASATIFGGETSTEIYCFDIEDDYKLPEAKRYNRAAKILWRQFIGSAMETNQYNQVIKSSVGSGLSSGYGKIYCCNNLGVIAAIDAIDGHIHWINEYHSHKKQKYQLRSNAIPRKIKWKNVPPTIKNGKLYVTPTDSDKLVIYDCFSGALQRMYPENTQNTIYDRVLGVDEEGIVYLGGIYARNTRIIALQERRSKEVLWEKNILGAIQGTGILGKNYIYFPVEKFGTRSLFSIDTKSGTYRSIQNQKNAKTRINPFGFGRKKQGQSALISFFHNNKNYLVLSGNNLSIITNTKK